MASRIHLQCRRPGFDSWVGKIPWKRAWQPISVALPGESHGQRSLASYSPWGHKESDTSEWLSLAHKWNIHSWSFKSEFSHFSVTFIHAVSCVRSWSLFIGEHFSIPWVYCTLFNHTLVTGCLGCNKFFTVKNQVTVCIHILMLSFLLDKHLRVKFLSHMANIR